MIGATLALLIYGSLDSTLNVGSLSKGEQIKIEIESNGCFNHSVDQLNVFGGIDKHLTYYESINGKKLSGNESSEPINLLYDGNASKELEQQIDMYLSYMREVTEKPGGCTSQTEINVVYIKDGKKIGFEELLDSGCYQGTLEEYFRDRNEPRIKKVVERTFKNPEKYKGMKNIFILLQSQIEKQSGKKAK